MKKLVIFLFTIAVFRVSVFGQLNTNHNHYRAGDVIVKQQVEYVNPGEAGANKVWDFSRLETINDEYTLTYSLPPVEGDSVYILGDKRYKKKSVKENELIVATEHNTMYYYHLTNDSLLQLGHENPSVKLKYTVPVTLMHFPLNYGQTVSSRYNSEGLYSGTINIETQGNTVITADAYGKMILPSGETLDLVLRVKTIQTIYDIANDNSGKKEAGENAGKQLETCRWYSKGYRYPVFETIRNINLADNSEIFTTAFFFPPQDHLYLDTDPENLALLEEIWDMERQAKQAAEALQNSETMLLEKPFSVKLYPNPVEDILNLEYELKDNADVSFQIYSIDGTLIKTINKRFLNRGFYNETINCAELPSKNYILRIWINRLSENEIFIKK